MTARGLLDLGRDGALARCCAPTCGWEGVPTSINGVVSTHCPKCEDPDDYDEIERELDLESMPRVGRNDPCPCGSGKKFKRCHLT